MILFRLSDLNNIDDLIYYMGIRTPEFKVAVMMDSRDSAKKCSHMMYDSLKNQGFRDVSSTLMSCNPVGIYAKRQINDEKMPIKLFFYSAFTVAKYGNIGRYSFIAVPDERYNAIKLAMDAWLNQFSTNDRLPLETFDIGYFAKNFYYKSNNVPQGVKLLVDFLNSFETKEESQ